MLWPCAETLRHISPHLPNGLLPPQVVPSLHATLSGLPGAVSSYYLECRLAPDADQVDFSVCMSAARGGRAVLQRERVAPGGLAPGSAWHRVQSFLECWAQPGTPLHEELSLVWLEFDRMDEAPQAPSVPCVNFCLDPSYQGPAVASRRPPHPNTRQYQPFVDLALAQLSGQPLSPRTRQTLATCFTALPPGGHIYYLALMLPRWPAALKVNGDVPREQLMGYLSRLGWPGDIAALARVLETYEVDAPSLRFDLTLGEEGVSPRLGIECFTQPSAGNEARRLRVLEQLVAQGHCSPEKRAAVSSWPGQTQVVFTGQTWPTLLRRSWYLKLVCHAGQLREAKVYLGFAPTLSSPF